MEVFDLRRHSGTERPCSGNPGITVEGSGQGLGFVPGAQWVHRLGLIKRQVYFKEDKGRRGKCIPSHGISL